MEENITKTVEILRENEIIIFKTEQKQQWAIKTYLKIADLCKDGGFIDAA